ncbi:MAG: restriction endonuclease subunit S [Bacteroidetes bacterium]|nr:restriction endonuclease subunit S [Bacteroidota bacterium]
MSKYDTYKETDVIWFKELPAHWKRKRVKDVTQTLAGGTPDTSKEEYWEGSIPWLPSGKVQNSIINEEDADTFITEEGLKNSATKMLPAPATLIALTGATCSNIGYLTFDACANQSVVGMPGSSKILPKFLFYTLQSQKEQILLHQTGGAQGGISESDVKFLFIPVPIESEQLTIANYLDNQTQKIDRLIANKKAQVEKLKELRQIEINNAVTKGLNPNAEMKDSGIEWLGKIPKHWEVKRLKNLANQISEKSSEILDDDFLVALENIESHTGKFIETASEYENNGIKFKKDNLLYNKLRPYLNKVFLADKDGICVGDIIVIECTTKLYPAFLQFRMLSDSFCSMIMSSVYGAKMPRTSWQFISSLKIAYPTYEEQVQIVEHLNKRTLAIERLIQNVNQQIEKLQELRKIKIYEAVTGKIKVNAYAETTA